MALTDQQIDYVMHMSVDTIMQFITEGRVVFPDDLKRYNKDAKFLEIQHRLANMPDQEAIHAWDEVKKLSSDSTQTQRAMQELTRFINRFSDSPSSRDMVDEARARLADLTKAIEAEDWNNVDLESVNSLLGHRRKYPTTSHESDIDNTVWELIDKGSLTEVNRYMNEFPNGLHYHECADIIKAQQMWLEISTYPDLVTLNDYVNEVSDSPFIPQAMELIAKLKKDAVKEMKDNPGAYSLEWLKTLMAEKIFERNELLQALVCTPKTLKFVENPPKLPDIEQKSNTTPEINEGATDVFLFGIPSSGKTCVLMGMLGATEFTYDNSDGNGGQYADCLKMFRENCKAPGRTYGNFVTQIQGVIRPENDSQICYPINLIEMSGEEFAMKIVYNESDNINLESMGTGATRLLTSNNRKVIFIVIDPTINGTIELTTQKADGSSVTRVVQQDIVISKIVNMLQHNKNVLKRTNAIHFIMTKSDKLGDRDDRDRVAVERVQTLYRQTINNLKLMCSEYSINATSNGSPLLYTFSLGQFYVCDLFEYDATDSNKIMDALKSMSQAKKAKGFFNQMKTALN